MCSLNFLLLKNVKSIGQSKFVLVNSFLATVQISLICRSKLLSQLMGLLGVYYIVKVLLKVPTMLHD